MWPSFFNPIPQKVLLKEHALLGNFYCILGNFKSCITRVCLMIRSVLLSSISSFHNLLMSIFNIHGILIYQKERIVWSYNCQNFLLFLGSKQATGTKVALQVKLNLQSFVWCWLSGRKEAENLHLHLHFVWCWLSGRKKAENLHYLMLTIRKKPTSTFS